MTIDDVTPLSVGEPCSLHMNDHGAVVALTTAAGVRVPVPDVVAGLTVEAKSAISDDRRPEVPYVTATAPTSPPVKRQLSPRALAGVVWAVFLLAAWLDRDGCVVANQASVFAALWSAITWLGDILGIAGGAIASSLEAVVSYLVTAVGWLASRVSNILLSTGGMFSRVWEWSKQIYDDVIKPGLVWLHDVYTRVSAWLATYFRPVFQFLSHVRAILMDLYGRFIRPILTALDLAHAVLRTLADFGVNWAKTLDAYVQRTEAIITENFLKVLGWINEVRDVVNAIVTPDRLFQQLPFVRTLERDAGHWIRIFWNNQIAAPDQAALDAAKARTVDQTAHDVYSKQLGAFYRDGSGDYAAEIAALVPVWQDAATTAA